MGDPRGMVPVRQTGTEVAKAFWAGLVGIVGGMFSTSPACCSSCLNGSQRSRT